MYMTETEIKAAWEKNEAYAVKVVKGICPRVFATIAIAKEQIERERVALERHWADIRHLRQQGKITDYAKIDQARKAAADFLALPWGIVVYFETFAYYDSEGVDLFDGRAALAMKYMKGGFDPMTETIWGKVAAKTHEQLRSLRLVTKNALRVWIGPHPHDGRPDAPEFFWASWVINVGAWDGPYATTKHFAY